MGQHYGTYSDEKSCYTLNYFVFSISTAELLFEVKVRRDHLELLPQTPEHGSY
jgi:hypothetical protein